MPEDVVRKDGHPVVRLRPMELRVAAQVAAERRIESLLSGRNANVHAAQSDLGTDFLGCCAEVAVAKLLGVYWPPGVNTFKAPDLGLDIQVRSTRHRGGHLIIRENDNDLEQAAVLVITEPPWFKVAGWIRIGTVREEPKAPPDERGVACWWWPQDRLLSMDLLMARETQP